MTGKFPIANRIKGGCQFTVFHGYGKDMLIEQDLHTALGRSMNDPQSFAFFDVNTASQLYWLGKKDYYRLSQDFGSLRMPYNRMWMEWTIGNQVMIDDKLEDRDEVTYHAAILEVIQYNDDFIVMRQLQFMAFTDADDVTFLPSGQQITINAHTGLFHPAPGSCQQVIPKDHMDSPPEHRKLIKELADPNVPWMALNLINCRNVTTKQTGTALHRTTREKRQGVPVTRYHTITLPGMQTRYVGAKGAQQHAKDMAHHLVRGHFATYGPDAPLFGKHVGTYWVGWHVRGDKKHGEVVKDYELGESA